MKMKFDKIVAVDRTAIGEFAREDLKKLCGTLRMFDDDPQSVPELLERAKDADAVLVSWRTRLSEEVLLALPRLRYIGMCCSLYDEASANVDLPAARRLGILVKGVRDYGDNGVVEFVFCELIRLVKGLGENRLRGEQIELDGLKLGIIGLGTVGRMAADIGSAFRMDVRYYARTRRGDSPYPYMDLDGLLRECDVVSAHLPRNAVLLKREQFALLGSGKVFINTGLGPCYDPDSFMEWIALPDNYAILDACSVDDTLRALYEAHPNIVVSKEVSGFTRNARKRLAQKTVANAAAALRELESRL